MSRRARTEDIQLIRESSDPITIEELEVSAELISSWIKRYIRHKKEEKENSQEKT